MVMCKGSREDTIFWAKPNWHYILGKIKNWVSTLISVRKNSSEFLCYLFDTSNLFFLTVILFMIVRKPFETWSWQLFGRSFFGLQNSPFNNMASCYLQRVMQRNTLDDKIVPDKQQWDIAVKFMEETLREKLQQSKKWGKKLCGRGEGGINGCICSMLYICKTQNDIQPLIDVQFSNPDIWLFQMVKSVSNSKVYDRFSLSQINVQWRHWRMP